MQKYLRSVYLYSIQTFIAATRIPEQLKRLHQSGMYSTIFMYQVVVVFLLIFTILEPKREIF